ncbi:MAG: TetR/AcrR family transcriptional regulator [Saprospiraceae bacterium]|nr:TetR/AcrR family transcriptional regulator [Saprospiraceae bacterium]MBL0101655.1 TetR/AcrR family transcriptional regulator [Saprospiraceae bacterium]
MGLAERKEREKAELRELILDAAKRILLKSGQEGLSIRKIANTIEYSPATIYLYFKDKDEILHELMEMGFTLMNKFMTKAYEEKDAVKRIYLIGKAYVEFGLEHKDWYDLMFNSDKPMKHIEKCMEDWDAGMAMFNYLASTCKEAMLSLQMHALEERILALQLWSCVHGLVNLAHTERLEIVERNQTKELVSKTLDTMFLSIFHK